jgi:hypothetical protein
MICPSCGVECGYTMIVEDGYKLTKDGKRVHNLTPTPDWAGEATARYLVCRGDTFTHWRAVYEDNHNRPLVVHRMTLLAGAYDKTSVEFKPVRKANRATRRQAPDWLP